MECGEQGCKALKDMHSDLYKDDGVRDKAMKSINASVIQKTFLSKSIFLWFAGFCIIFASWSTMTIFETKAKADKVNHIVNSIDSKLDIILNKWGND